MKEKEARAEIVKILADNNWFMVTWFCHLVPLQIVILTGGKHKPEIYGAIYEQFFDATGDAKELGRFVPKSKTFRGLYAELNRFIKKRRFAPTMKNASATASFSQNYRKKNGANVALDAHN